jgi:hypothetical protein
VPSRNELSCNASGISPPRSSSRVPAGDQMARAERVSSREPTNNSSRAQATSAANRSIAGTAPVDDCDRCRKGNFWQRPVAWYHY